MIYHIKFSPIYTGSIYPYNNKTIYFPKSNPYNIHKHTTYPSINQSPNKHIIHK